jgi:hypothetical protein
LNHHLIPLEAILAAYESGCQISAIITLVDGTSLYVQGRPMYGP